MASTPKRLKTETENPEGYVHNVSQMTTSARGHLYFNADLQEEKEIVKLVGYSPKHRDELLAMQNQRTPVQLRNTEQVQSWSSPGKFDVKLTRHSSISAARVLFPFDKIEPRTKAKEVVGTKTIEQINDIMEGSKVSVSVKVLRKMETVQQNVRSEEIQRTTYLIADKTGTIQLTVWGDEMLKEETIYRIENVTVKFFSVKKLSTNKHSKMTIIPDLIDIVQTDTSLEKITAKILGVKLTNQTKCCFCNHAVVLNLQATSFKCSTCEQRQLNEVAVKETKCSLKCQDQETKNILSLELPSHVLSQVVPEDVEDKEIFLLEKNMFTMTVRNKVIETMLKVEKMN